MREAKRTIFYCDFCGRHKHRRSSMERHERHCTLNPDRTCRWSIDDEGHPEFVLRAVSAQLAVRAGGTRLVAEDIDWLREKVGGCPACMLAALRQSGIRDYHYGRDYQTIFVYEKEVERYRSEEREHWYMRESFDIERSFL